MALATVFAVVLVSRSLTNGTRTQEAPLADSVPRAATEWDEMAQQVLLAPPDVDGFALAPQRDYSVPEDVVLPECEAVDQLDERYGEYASAWGISYARPATPTESEVQLGESVLVWESDRVAVPRMSGAVTIIGPCRRAQIEYNFEQQAEDRSIEPLDAQLLDVDVPETAGVATGGYRVRLSASLGGLDFPIYYDLLFVAKGRIIVVVDLAVQVRPFPKSDQADILPAVADRVIRAQQ